MVEMCRERRSALPSDLYLAYSHVRFVFGVRAPKQPPRSRQLPIHFGACRHNAQVSVQEISIPGTPTLPATLIEHRAMHSPSLYTVVVMAHPLGRCDSLGRFVSLRVADFAAQDRQYSVVLSLGDPSRAHSDWISRNASSGLVWPQTTGEWCIVQFRQPRAHTSPIHSVHLVYRSTKLVTNVHCRHKVQELSVCTSRITYHVMLVRLDSLNSLSLHG